jgi:ATP-dependent Clp protease ATP-binding subunit ClpA
VASTAADAYRAVLAAAAEEAARLGDRRLGTDHLLLALLRDPDAAGCAALGVEVHAARQTLEALDRRALAAVGIRLAWPCAALPAALSRRPPPLGSGVRLVLGRAARLGRGATPCGAAERILAALLESQLPDPAAQLMAALGVDRAEARRRLGRLALGEAV